MASSSVERTLSSFSTQLTVLIVMTVGFFLLLFFPSWEKFPQTPLNTLFIESRVWILFLSRLNFSARLSTVAVLVEISDFAPVVKIVWLLWVLTSVNKQVNTRKFPPPSASSLLKHEFCSLTQSNAAHNKSVHKRRGRVQSSFNRITFPYCHLQV